jgi:hypothetical protein
MKNMDFLKVKGKAYWEKPFGSGLIKRHVLQIHQINFI